MAEPMEPPLRRLRVFEARLPPPRRDVSYAPALHQHPEDRRCGLYAAYHATCLAHGEQPDRTTFEELAARLIGNISDMDEQDINDLLDLLEEPRVVIVSDVDAAIRMADERAWTLMDFFPSLARALDGFEATPQAITLVLRQVQHAHWFAAQIQPSEAAQLHLVIAESVPTLRPEAEVTARAIRNLFGRRLIRAAAAPPPPAGAHPGAPPPAVMPFDGAPRSRVARWTEGVFPPSPTIDLENVMRSDRIARAQACVRVLLADEGPNGLDRATHDAIDHFFAELEAAVRDGAGELTIGERATLSRRRGRTGRVIENARRTLDGPRMSDDYSDSLASGNVSMVMPEGAIDVGDIAARVWRRIERHVSDTPEESAREQRAMRWSYLMALEQCIEDDGHRVCGVGLTERLVGVLQGYCPDIHADPEVITPRQLLCELGLAWQGRLADASDASVCTAFRREAMARAREVFGASGPEVRHFERELEQFLVMYRP